MDKDLALLVGGAILFFAILIGGMVGGEAYKDALIAEAADPLAVACALNREKACTASAAKK
jgi:hypothetical protein